MKQPIAILILSALVGTACVAEEADEVSETTSAVFNNSETIAGGGFCLDTQYGSGDAGAPVFVWGCHGTGQQRWTITPDNMIYSASGMCLEAVAGGTANYTPLALWYCHGLPHQRWIVEGEGWYVQIRGQASNKCLTRFGTTEGSSVVLLPCDGGEPQRWVVESWTQIANARYPNECWNLIDYNPKRMGTGSCDSYDWGHYFEFDGSRIHHWDDTYCFEAESSSLYSVPNHARILVKDCNGRFNQAWTYENGAIKTVLSNRCITRWWTSSGTVELRARTCDGSDVQKWFVVPDGD